MKLNKKLRKSLSMYKFEHQKDFWKVHLVMKCSNYMTLHDKEVLKMLKNDLFFGVMDRNKFKYEMSFKR